MDDPMISLGQSSQQESRKSLEDMIAESIYEKPFQDLDETERQKVITVASRLKGMGIR